MKSSFVPLLAFSLVGSLSAWAQDNPKPYKDNLKSNMTMTVCEPVCGVLMTNINAIALPSATNGTNLGPVFGDLKGSVAATIVGGSASAGYDVQHYWVTASGDTIKFNVAHLKPGMVTRYGASAPAADLVAVGWGDYVSAISGGTGKYENATGSLSYFGLADFTNLTLVLRYSGQVCYAP
jgi:hypothetical protein